MKKFLCLLSCLIVISSLQAQYYYYNSRFYESPLSWELAASAAAMNCLTDVGKKDRAGIFPPQLSWQCTRPGIAISGKALYENKLGLRLTCGYGSVTGSDSINAKKTNASSRYERNLQFETTILEALLLAELYPLSLLGSSRHPVYLFTPYVLAGFGVFHFNPVARLAGIPVRLQPLRTEGQGFPGHPDRKPYALNQFNLPFGFGIKHEISAIILCGVELLYRKLFTDYLDDVSGTYINPLEFYDYFPARQAALASTLANRQRKNIPHQDIGKPRGNPQRKDAYLSINLKVAVNLSRERR